MEKYIALALIITGLACIAKAMNMDRTSSFASGTFIGELAMFIIGGGFVIAGLVIIGVMAFQEL